MQETVNAFQQYLDFWWFSSSNPDEKRWKKCVDGNPSLSLTNLKFPIEYCLNSIQSYPDSTQKKPFNPLNSYPTDRTQKPCRKKNRHSTCEWRRKTSDNSPCRPLPRYHTETEKKSISRSISRVRRASDARATMGGLGGEGRKKSIRF